MSSCVCKISFKSVQVCGGCCKMFRGLTFLGHSVVILHKASLPPGADRSIIFTRWRQSVPLSNTSCLRPAKRHLDWFIRFSGLTGVPNTQTRTMEHAVNICGDASMRRTQCNPQNVTITYYSSLVTDRRISNGPDPERFVSSDCGPRRRR